MRLTIVTACWNAKNLPIVMKSLEDQTYQDFQHILINDNNPEVRDVFKGMCDGIKRHWVDVGVRTHYYGALARNIGVQVAFSYLHASKRDIENEWIIFHDDDNYWKPNHLQSIVDTIQKNPEATMIATDAIWVGVNDKTWMEERKCSLRHGGCDLGQFAYKTSLFRKYGYFEPHPRRKQRYDWELIKKMSDGEGDKLVCTNGSTFLMSYRKR